MKKYRLHILTAVFTFCCLTMSLTGQTHSSNQPHDGSITALAAVKSGTETFCYTAGEDGFIIKWNKGLGEHFQISDYQIKMIAVHPNGNDIAIYETDGFTIHRISIWNWTNQNRRFVKRLTDTVVSLAYSSKGSFLMIGTTSVDGILFMDTAKGNLLTNKVKNPPGIVSFAQSSGTENSGLMYSPLGYLIYANLRTGAQKAAFQIESGLNQSLIFNNNVLFAGAKNDGIFLFQADTGEKITRVPASNPFLCTSPNDANLYYFETDGKNGVLKMIEVENGYVKSSPLIIKNFVFSAWDQPARAVKQGDIIYIGMRSGDIYSIDINPNSEKIPADKISQRNYDKIYDIAEQDGIFYFLTRSSIFKSYYEDSTIYSIAANTGYTNFIPYGEFIILWSKETRQTVKLLNLSDGTSQTLFSPSLPLQGLRLQDKQIIFIEGSTKVQLFDLTDKRLNLLYTGTGVQDALLYTPTDLYIAKSAAGTPKSALVQVSVDTKETIAIDIPSSLSFSLAENQNKEGPFYGVSLFADSSGSKTEIFAFYPNTKQYVPIFKWADEDTRAFTYFKNGVLLTNIGKTQVHAYTIQTKKDLLLKRSASLPLKLASTDSTLLVLNKDGSISWYAAQTKQFLKNWYITTEGEWLEY